MALLMHGHAFGGLADTTVIALYFRYWPLADIR